MRDYLTRVITTPIGFVERLIPDEADAISAAIIELADVEGCCLILTTGGTGPAGREDSR